MNVICLYQVLSLFDTDVYVSIFHNSNILYGGYIPNVPTKYAKYPVMKIKMLDLHHIIIRVV